MDKVLIRINRFVFFFNYRSSDDGSERNDNHDDDDDEDEDDDDDDDDETDESIARRLGFLPLTAETVDIIGRLRSLINKKSFVRRDFETFQSLIDELIHIQHLENASKEQLKEIIHLLKLHRPLHSKSRALIFLQERIPRRAVKYNVISTNPPHSNVFNIWRERERRARLDSKDSLEDDGQNLSGQQLRDVVEINHPTPPIVLSVTSSNSNASSKVKQMAKDIDTRSGTSRSEINLRTGDRFSDHTYIPRSSSPVYPGLVAVAVYDIKSINNQNESLISPTVSEPSHVRKLIDRLESSSNSSTSEKKNERKISIKKSLHDDQSDGSTSFTSSPPAKRILRRDSNHEKPLVNRNESLIIDQTQLHVEQSPSKNTSSELKFELNREEIMNKSRRTASGTSVSFSFIGTINNSFILDRRICHYTSSRY